MKVPHKNIRLNANENFYGCSPYALEAIKNNINDIHFYPDYFHNELKEKIASRLQVRMENIVLGVGTVGIIDTIIKSVVATDEEIITYERSFVAYGQLASLHKRKIHFVPLTDFYCIPNNILPFINEKTKALFIVNPNNPTGTMFGHKELKEFLNKIPENIWVIIDEAYYEYVTEGDYADSLLLLKEYSNLIVLRGFSKSYGLGGLRIGYGIASEEKANLLNSYRLPFSINSLAAPACIAAINDQDFINECVKQNSIERSFLIEEIRKKGIQTTNSNANYIFLWFDDENKKDLVHKKLLDNGLYTCNLKIFNQSNSIRIAIADRTINSRIISLL